jgi:acetyltransferase-like isoleucine patch superfamily enzyme
MLGKILDTVVGGLIRNVPGGIGQRLRSAYWRRRFRSCGRVKIDEGVLFQYPEQIEIGNNVWIMPYAVLTAPAPGHASSDAGKNVSGTSAGRLTIGDEVQIGAFNVINGTGGLEIGNCVTLSARVSVYSATHLPRNPEDPVQEVGCNGMVRRLPVYAKQGKVTIGHGAWLGLHTVVICCNVGRQSFVTAALAGLRARAAQRGFDDAIIFLGFVPESDIPALYGGMYLFVTIDWADYRITTYEVLAENCRVIVLDETDADLALLASGYLFSSPAEAAALADTIERALATPVIWDRAQLAEHLTRFSWPVYFDQVSAAIVHNAEARANAP